MVEGLIAATKEVKDLHKQLDDFLILCSHKFQTANWTLSTSIPSADLPTFAPLAILVFDKDMPKWWIQQCEGVFYQHRVAEKEKVKMVAANLSEIPCVWFQNWSWGRVEWSWPQFVNALCTRFGERPKTNVVIGVPKAAHQEVQGADIVAMEEEGGVHTTKEEYEADEVLRTRREAARKEDSPADLIDLQKQQRKELEKSLYQVLEEKDERIAPGTLFGTSHTYVFGTGTQNRAAAAKKVDLLKEKFKFLLMLGNEMVTGLTAPLEPFSMAMRKRWMAGLGLAASRSSVKEEGKRKQKKKVIREENKKRRRRNQLVKMGIG